MIIELIVSTYIEPPPLTNWSNYATIDGLAPYAVVRESISGI